MLLCMATTSQSSFVILLRLSAQDAVLGWKLLNVLALRVGCFCRLGRFLEDLHEPMAWAMARFPHCEVCTENQRICHDPVGLRYESGTLRHQQVP